MKTTESPTVGNLHTLMRADHLRLEVLFGEITAAAESGVDARTLGELWTRFTGGLRAHFEAEETQVFPRLAARHPEEVATLLREHEAINRALEELDVAVDLHRIRAEQVQSFVQMIRAHAAGEDEKLYRWTDEELPEAQKASLYQHLIGREL